MSGKQAKKNRQKQHDIVRGFLLKSLTTLRLEFARRLKIQRQKFPKMQLPCETCAFRSSTDNDVGFETTVLSFVHAMATDSMFHCHRDLEHGPDGEYLPATKVEGGHRVIDYDRMPPCAAWFVLSSTTPEPLDIRKALGPELVDELVKIHAKDWA